MSSEARRRIVCRCLGVSSPRVFAAVRDGGLATVREVTKTIGAGGGCTLCHREIEEILGDVRGAPIEPALSIENELVCRQESQACVEGALVGRIASRLAPLGARVEGVAVDGLRVAVRLGGARSEAAARLVVEQLRACVCADLEIEVG